MWKQRIAEGVLGLFVAYFVLHKGEQSASCQYLLHEVAQCQNLSRTGNLKKLLRKNSKKKYVLSFCRSHWPRGLRRGSATIRLVEFVGSNPAGGMNIYL
jgi:hypothetical protein